MGSQIIPSKFTPSILPYVAIFRYKSIELGANQGSIYHWARDHRLHHKFSDTLLDPHSMKRGMFFSHMGWLLQNKSPELIT